MVRILGLTSVPGESKKFARLAGGEMKCMWPIFEIEMLIKQSKANFDEKILFDQITHILGPKIRKMPVRVFMGIENSTFHSRP